jgi:outer membrane protein assembly factor BamB
MKLTKLFLLIYSILLLTACNTMERKLELPNKKALLPVINAVELNKIFDSKIIDLKPEDALNSALILAKSANKLFVADALGHVIALDLNAKVLWKISLKETITTGPNFFKDKLYIVTNQAKLICLSADSGEILWATPVSSETLAELGFSDEKSMDLGFVHTIDGGLSAINLMDGRQLWRFSTVVPNMMLRRGSKPIVTDNYVISGFANGKLFALDKKDASMLWSYNIANPQGRFELQRVFDISADPVVKDNKVYAVSYQGNLISVKLDNGELIWEKEVSSYSGLVVDKNVVYIAAKDGIIYALDANTGSNIWSQQELIGRILSKPVIIDNYIVISDMDGNLHFFDKHFGRIKARLSLDSKGIFISPIVDLNNKILYILTNSGRLIAVKYVTSSHNSR